MEDEILILGGGFLGVNTALELLDTDSEVKIIDKDLTHEYTPGNIDLIRDRVSTRDISVDLAEFLEDVDIELIEEEVLDVRPEEEVVETGKGLYRYDQLILGLGGKPRTFGMDVSEAESIWSVGSTEELVEQVDEAGKAVIVGSGYTGLETAGEIAENGVETIVVEAKTRPAPALTEESSEKLLEMMNQKGIDFRGGKMVEEITDEGVKLEEGEIEADVVIWCGGVEASDLVEESLGVEPCGVSVNRGLSVEGHENIFAGGDNADVGCLKTAHNAMSQADVIAENTQIDNRELKQFDTDRFPIAVSLGDTGVIVLGDEIVWTGFPSRIIKDWVRKYYFLRLRWKKFSNAKLPL